MKSSSSTPSLRVGLCIDRWDPARGGAEKAMALLAGWLENRGHNVLVFGRERPASAANAPGEFVAVKASGLTRGRRERNLGRAMLNAARDRQCHVVIGVRHMESVDILWPHGGTHAGTLRALAKRATGRHRAFLDLEHKAIAGGGAARILCVSNLIREEVLTYYPGCEERLLVIANGVDLERYRIAARAQAEPELRRIASCTPGAPVITFVARNPELKGLELLLNSLAQIQDEPWSLVIAGPRDVAGVERQIGAALRQPGRVHVSGEIDSVTLAAGSDLLVLPSRRDPCPLVVLEALACGTPVLVSEAVGSKDAIESDAQGAAFPTESSPAELAKHVRSRLKSIAAGEFTREQIAASMAHRGLDNWLGAIETLVLDFAASKGVSSPHE